MTVNDRSMQPLTVALEDHSAEGVTILTSAPSRLTGLTIWLLVALLTAALGWSFIGRADVTVTAVGTLSPDSEARRLYAPIDGELAEIYITEGLPVVEGDVLARLNARSAIKAATEARDADLQLADTERRYQQFMLRKPLLEQRAESLLAQIAIAQRLHDKRVSEGMKKLADSQRAKLEEARGNLATAKRTLRTAKLELEKYERLLRTPGGGGVSEIQVEEKRNAFLSARISYRLAKAKIGELDYQLSNEHSKAQAELETSHQNLTELRIKYETAIQDIQDEESDVALQLSSARLAAETASRTRFENIDEDNFLRIVAPVSGVITEVAYTQPGEKITANAPLGSIAPHDAQPVLKIEISEADRGFLKEGLPVKTKFSAFPYQRYGFIAGTLEYISPAARNSSQDDQAVPVYSGHIRLERDYVRVGETRYPLRYGMVATVEIAVRERRLIDLALDPLRELAG